MFLSCFLVAFLLVVGVFVFVCLCGPCWPHCFRTLLFSGTSKWKQAHTGRHKVKIWKTKTVISCNLICAQTLVCPTRLIGMTFSPLPICFGSTITIPTPAKKCSLMCAQIIVCPTRLIGMTSFFSFFQKKLKNGRFGDPLRNSMGAKMSPKST